VHGFAPENVVLCLENHHGKPKIQQRRTCMQHLDHVDDDNRISQTKHESLDSVLRILRYKRDPKDNRLKMTVEAGWFAW
jgi:hypothetical protein